MIKKIMPIYLVVTFFAFHTVCYSGPIALFSPDDKPTLKLIDLIKNARISINTAIYMFSDKTIAEELVLAHKRGVKIKVVIDRASTGEYGKAQLLHDNGIPVSVFDTDEKKVFAHTHIKEDPRFFNNAALMHNKFMVIDHKLLWTGSFNWSVAANKKNQENIIILDDKNLCTQFENHFTKILSERCKPFASKQPAPVQSPLHEKINQILINSANDTILLQNLSVLLAQYKPHKILPE